jgi:predicted nucleic-acid-binding protein
MISVDTNVVVRLLVGDDPAQAQRAARVFEEGDIFLAKTVVLETEWVLRYAYGLAPGQIVAALRKLFGLAGMTLEDAATVAEALIWHERGLDFGDALHAASSRRADRFATFDRDLVKRAKKVGVGGVVAV